MIAIAFACGAAAAQASPFVDNTSVELFVGGNAVTPGSFRAAHAPLASEAGGNAVYDSLGFSGVYDHRYSGGGELDYAFDEHFIGFARAAYAQFDGTNHEIGQFFSDTAGRLPINASFDDTSTRELSLGARYAFSPGARFRPFVGLALGAADLSATRASIENPNTGVMTPVELGRGGSVLEQRIETGLSYSPVRNFDLRLTAAATHLDSQKPSNDPNLALLGLNAQHGDVPGHWDYPAELGAVWHF